MSKSMENLEWIVKKSRNLPIFPQVTTKLMQVVSDTKAQAKDVSKIIESDQSLATRILRQVNSPFYGFSGRISTIQHAVVIMGFDAVKNLATGFSIAKMSRKKNSTILNEEKFWEHSLGVAIGARSIAKEIKYPCPEELFLAGLLHDIGKLILSDNLPGEYIKVLKLAEEKEEEIYQSEKNMFKVSHAEVGEWFTKENRFPPLLRACVKYHHTPSSQSSGEFIKAVKTIYLADRLCKLQKIGWAGDNICTGETESIYKEIGITTEIRERVVETLKTEVDETKEFFKTCEDGTSKAILTSTETSADLDAK